MKNEIKRATRRTARREGRFWLGAIAAALIWLLVASF